LKTDPAQALTVKQNPLVGLLRRAAFLFGAEQPGFAALVLQDVQKQRQVLWETEIRDRINWELFDRGVEAFTWSALEELARGAQKRGWLEGVPHASETARLADDTNRFGPDGKGGEYVRPRAPGEGSEKAPRPFIALRQELEKPLARRLFLWRRQPGKKGDLLQEMDSLLQMPGWSNIWTQPIQNRVDMLATGVRTQIGVKVYGPDLGTIDRVSREVEAVLKLLDGAQDVIAEPILGKGYVQIDIDRRKAARYGVRVKDIQDTIEVALGGKAITQTVEGRYRFPVRIRYARDFRTDEQAVKRLLVSREARAPMSAGTASADSLSSAGPPRELHKVAPEHEAAGGGFQIPLGDVADVRIVEGPTAIKSENGRLRNYVTLNVSGSRDITGFVDEAQRVVAAKVALPEGVHLAWSGEFEHQVRAARTLRFVFPAVILLIFLILYFTYKDVVDAGLMLLAVPEALAGGVFLQFLFPKILHGWSARPLDFSVAVWIGYIAAFGMATETGIIMLVYLREALEKRGGLAKIQSLDELKQAVIEGAVHRLRPKLLTEGVAIIALAPMLFSTGVGSEILSAMALPVLGGLLIADEVVDIFLPVRFYWVRRARWLKLREQRRPELGSQTTDPQLIGSPAFS
jgi:Cu(I)/Ag(I) efflux system membrane protein CusA/SilA